MDDDAIGCNFELYRGRRRRTAQLRQIGFTAPWGRIKEDSMPKVGKRTFPYTKSGKAAAKAAEKKLPSRKMVGKKMKEAR
jgi:hypothetical protein